MKTNKSIKVTEGELIQILESEYRAMEKANESIDGTDDLVDLICEVVEDDDVCTSSVLIWPWTVKRVDK